jgi:predicted ATPase
LIKGNKMTKQTKYYKAEVEGKVCLTQRKNDYTVAMAFSREGRTGIASFNTKEQTKAQVLNFLRPSKMTNGQWVKYTNEDGTVVDNKARYDSTTVWAVKAVQITKEEYKLIKEQA